MYRFILIIFLLPQAIISLNAQAESVYQEPGNFINEIFSGNPPAPAKLWLTGELQEKIRLILGHDLNVLRLRYWQQDNRTAWILEEIGKERPITTGIVINQGKIELIRILIFRESRGWEVRYPFFTDQFKGAKLVDNTELDKPVDGISGATLSVNAVTKQAKVALMLHEQVESKTTKGKQD